MQGISIKILTERISLINTEIIQNYINENLKIVVKHAQNGMIYLKLEGSQDKLNELEKLIKDAKGS
jgi:hypothetical protein